MKDDAYITIEPCQGETYLWDGKTYAAYENSVFPESSVLAGQPRRSFLDSSEELDALKAKFPKAEVSEGTSYVPPEVPTTAPDWFDPDYAGESWDGD